VDSKKLGNTFDQLQAAIEALENSGRRSGDSEGVRTRKHLRDAKRLIAQLRRRCKPFSSQDEELSRLASIVRCSDDAILSKDLNGIIRSWNKSAERLFGYSRREIVGRSIKILFPPDRIDEEAMILRRLRQGRPIKHYETVRRRKDGSLVEVSIWLSPIRDSAGKIRGAAKIVRDISDHKGAEAALREREQRMAGIVQAAVDAIITIDERGAIESVNPATERLFAYSAAEMLGRNVRMLMPEPYRGEHDGYLAAYVKTGHARIIGIGREVTAMRKDGTTFPMSLGVSEVRLADRRLFTGIIHDLSSRRQLEQQIIEASVHEQRRIGQDLHDGLCQDLIGIAFGADRAARQLAARGASEAEAVDRLATSMREAAGHARQLSHGLNPVDLKAGGLPVALEALADRISESFRVACNFEWDGRAEVTKNAAATHLYRISQEAAGNSLKHGKARRIQIALREIEGRIMLTIADDGVGVPASRTFVTRLPHRDASPLTSENKDPGIGMMGMRYRANLMNGTFEIEPQRAGGTLVTCSVPAANVTATATAVRKSPLKRRVAAQNRQQRRNGTNVRS
jgi:two-component system sensor kinase FixL